MCRCKIQRTLLYMFHMQLPRCSADSRSQKKRMFSGTPRRFKEEQLILNSYGLVLWELFTRQEPYAGMETMNILEYVLQGMFMMISKRTWILRWPSPHTGKCSNRDFKFDSKMLGGIVLRKLSMHSDSHTAWTRCKTWFWSDFGTDNQSFQSLTNFRRAAFVMKCYVIV